MFVSALLASAGPSLAGAIEPAVTRNAENGPAVNAAIARARATLPDFWQHLAASADDESLFLIKFNLSNGMSDAEYIWVGDIQLQNGRISGVLMNQPLNGRYRKGQQVEIPESAIGDWAIFKGRVMQGNHTTRVQLEQMPAEEAAQLRSALDW